jgi:glycosyltransferase involved in cell wall biosynthesis
MIEAMACGTPVIGWRRGSVPEIVYDGVNGFIVNGVEEAVKAIKKLETLDRRACRRAFEERFTATQMARRYEGLYHRVIQQQSKPCAIGGLGGRW